MNVENERVERTVPESEEGDVSEITLKEVL